ncbi:hypothetical protein [Pedobacter sp.]
MEQLKIISTALPFGMYLNIEKTEFKDELNNQLNAWVKSIKPKSYRILNVTIQEITHQKAILYSMFIAYENK